MKSKETSLDYGYVGDTVTMRDEGLPSLVLCCKDVTEWTVNHVVDFINGFGYNKLVIKADQKSATK